MLYMINIIVFIYIFLLFRKKHPVSLSMFWIVVFYLIYVLLPMLKDKLPLLSQIPPSIVNEIELYTLIGLMAFITTNSFFLVNWKKINLDDLKRDITLTHNSVRTGLFLFIVVTILLMFISLGKTGIIELFTSGSVNVWLNPKYDGIFATFAELGLFYIAIIGSLNVFTADTKNKVLKAVIVFILILFFVSLLVYARRHVIYPLFAAVFYWLTKKTNKTQLLIYGVIIIPVFFILMFTMGYFRTYGITNINLGNMMHSLLNENFANLFLSNTDFAMSYYFLSKQLEIGNIFVGPLGYFKVFFAWIPRSIWASKPNYTSVEILSIIEYLKVSNGFSAATGYIGEALAATGKFGIIIVSSLWGFFCGWLDQKYESIQKLKEVWKKEKGIEYGFTLFEFFYVYTGMLLITESHRGDLGASSLDFVLEIVFIGIVITIIQKVQAKVNLNNIH